MKIIICGSLSAKDEIVRIKKHLEEAGHIVEIPEGIKHEHLQSKMDAGSLERADIKIKHDLIRGYYKKIKLHDVVLIVNPEKKGVGGYIGGNTLIEMAFAHVLSKPLYVLYEIPEMNYTAEILATQPKALKGDIMQLFLKI